MSWYWIVLIVAAAVGLLLLGIGYFFFYLACVRVRQPEPTQESLLGRAVFRGHQDAVRAGWAWMSQQSFTRVETRSYDGLRLVGHYLPAPEQKGVLVLFHGYRSSWRIDFCCGLEQYRRLGLGLLVVDQRAHGESQGRYITYGVREHRDVLTWVDYVNQKLGKDTPVFLAGLSMGSTTVQLACGLALPQNVRGVISDCGFTSAYDILLSVGKEHLHGFAPLAVALAIPYCRIFAGFDPKGFSTLDAQRKNHIPTLFIHGGSDRLVPCEMSEANYRACAAKDKTLLMVPDAWHGTSYLVDTPRYEQAVRDFILRNL